MWRTGTVAAAGLAVLVLLSLAPAAQAELRGHGGFVKGIAVSPDGHRAVSASFDYSLILWDLDGQQAIEVLDDHAGAVSSLPGHGSSSTGLPARPESSAHRSKSPLRLLWNAIGADGQLASGGPVGTPPLSTVKSMKLIARETIVALRWSGRTSTHTGPLVAPGGTTA